MLADLGHDLLRGVLLDELLLARLWAERVLRDLLRALLAREPVPLA